MYTIIRFIFSIHSFSNTKHYQYRVVLGKVNSIITITHSARSSACGESGGGEEWRARLA